MLKISRVTGKYEHHDVKININPPLKGVFLSVCESDCLYVSNFTTNKNWVKFCVKVCKDP